MDKRAGETKIRSASAVGERASTGWAAAKVGSVGEAQAEARVDTLVERPWIEAALANIDDRPHAGFSLRFAALGDSLRVIGLVPQHDAAGNTVGALGFTGSARKFAGVVFSQLWMSPRILPQAITRGLPSDSLLAARVTTLDGREVYRTHGWDAALRSDTASMLPFAGELHVRVALRPDAVRSIQGGIAPVSRMPVWIGLLLLTGMLALYIIRILQREHELAKLRLDFTASVSHELRTPLAQILLFGETLTLGRTRSENDRKDAASVIVREARRLMHLVDNTLTFSRGEKPVAMMSPQLTVVAPLVEDTIASFVPLASARGVSIDASLDREVAASVDSAAFRQMLLNLLDNAVKYGPAGQRVSVTLAGGFESSARRFPGLREAGAPNLRLIVDDEGPGVSEGDRNEIWLAFSRGAGHGAPKGTGFGLGLAVVQDVATRHGGTAWVEAAPSGRGARFVVELPQVREPSRPATPPSGTRTHQTEMAEA